MVGQDRGGKGGTMDEFERSEVIEVDGERFIQLEFARRWPKYTVDWWVRQKAGDGDYPVAHGSVERMPPSGSDDLEQLWDELGAEAQTQALEAAEGASAATEQRPAGRSLLDRLLGRSR